MRRWYGRHKEWQYGNDVGELKQALANKADSDFVVLAKDGEGNSYSPLAGEWEALYVPENTWSGDVYLRALTDDDRADGYTEEDLYDGDDGQPVLVLYPVN